MMTSITTGEIKRMLTLKMCDNEEFYLEESLAFQSELIKDMVKKKHVSVISLPIFVKRDALVKIIEYLKKHAEMTDANAEFKNFKKEHLNVDFDGLYDMMISATYLKIKNLKEMYAEAIAEKIKNKSVESVRKMFGIENDFTPEEEDALRKETPWVFESDEVDHTID